MSTSSTTPFLSDLDTTDQDCSSIQPNSSTCRQDLSSAVNPITVKYTYILSKPAAAYIGGVPKLGSAQSLDPSIIRHSEAYHSA